MNKEIFLTHDGKEVTYGDLIKWQTTTTEDGYYCSSKYVVTLTKNNAEDLVKDGIITPVEGESESYFPDYFKEAVENMFKTLDEKTDGPYVNIFDKIIRKYPGAATNMLLKELAIIFNKKYNEDKAENYSVYSAPYVYSISLNTHQIVKIPSKAVKDWTTFAAFLSEKDAYKAKDIIDGIKQKD